MITEKQVTFFHIELAGTPYQVGRIQGEAAATVPGWADFLRSGKGKFEAEQVVELQRQAARYCPGLNEEIEGMADALGVAPQEVIYYATTYLLAGHCSHFAALPAVTAGGNVLAGRSYEFGDAQDDLRLVTTRIQGKYAHLGFSIMLLGRGEGMNECGLSVTSSAGGFPVGAVRPAIQDGFQFWALERALLENCRDVSEGLALIEEFPLCCNPILILADKSGRAALVELHGSERAVKEIGPETEEQTLCAANHYTLPQMAHLQNGVMRNSRVRHQAWESFLAGATPGLEAAQVREFMATGYPQGPRCHYYEGYFGTLRSLVFDLTLGEAWVCCGSPALNPWRKLRLADHPQPAPLMARLPQEPLPEGFFDMM